MGDIPDNAVKWIVGDDTGQSSIAIWCAMTDQTPRRGWSYPYDEYDLGRCLRLLNAVPEWKPRISVMAKKSPKWAALIAHWDVLTSMMERECGEEIEKTLPAPETSALMDRILSSTKAGA